MVIDAFLEITCLAHDKLAIEKADAVEYYPTFGLSGELLEQETCLKSLVPDAAAASVLIQELIRRGLVVPDYAPARVSGDDWSFIFGLSADTATMRELLIEARDMLPAI